MVKMVFPSSGRSNLFTNAEPTKSRLEAFLVNDSKDKLRPVCSIEDVRVLYMLLNVCVCAFLALM